MTPLTSHQNNINKIISALDPISFRAMVMWCLLTCVHACVRVCLNMLCHLPATSLILESFLPWKTMEHESVNEKQIYMFEFGLPINVTLAWILWYPFWIVKRFMCKSKRNKFVAPGFRFCCRRCRCCSCYFLFLFIFFDYSFASYCSYLPYFQSLFKAYFMGQPSARAKHLNLRKSPSVYGKLHVISFVVVAVLLHTVCSSNVWS